VNPWSRVRFPGDAFSCSRAGSARADSRRSIPAAAGQIPEGGGFAAAKSSDDGPAGPAPL
jgi:hypothetical protein